LLIGVGADSNERATGLLTMSGSRAKTLAIQLRDICVAHIKPAIEGLEIQPFCMDELKDEWLVIAAIPPSTRKPHMSAFRQRTKFYVRVGNRKREMTYEEILQAFTAKNDQYFAQIISRLDHLSERPQTPLTSAELEESDWWEITNPKGLSDKLRLHFVNMIGKNRFFRLVAIPRSLQDYAAKLGDENVHRLLRNSVGRRDGWTTRAFPPLRRMPYGLETEKTDYHHVLLLNSGTLEFSTAVDSQFCWQQPAAAMEKHPRLYPHAVVEYPASFCREYLQLAAFLGMTSDITFQMEYRNIEGAILLPFRPGTFGFDIPFEPVQPWKKNDLVVPPRNVAYPFMPDEVAFSMVLNIYLSFGYTEEHIPFRTEDGKFEF